MSKTYWLSSPETSDLFERLVLEIFDFLITDYGFAVMKTEKDGHGARITLGSNAAAIQLNYEPGGLRIWVLLYRLLKGHLPEYPLTVIPGEKSDLFYIQDIMVAKEPRIRGSDLYVSIGQLGMFTPITEEYLREKLQTIADCVRQYAQDVLAGNFTIFEEAQKVRDARVSQYLSQNENR
jgi:hypothetical protein